MVDGLFVKRPPRQGLKNTELQIVLNKQNPFIASGTAEVYTHFESFPSHGKENVGLCAVNSKKIVYIIHTAHFIN